MTSSNRLITKLLRGVVACFFCISFKYFALFIFFYLCFAVLYWEIFNVASCLMTLVAWEVSMYVCNKFYSFSIFNKNKNENYKAKLLVITHIHSLIVNKLFTHTYILVCMCAHFKSTSLSHIKKKFLSIFFFYNFSLIHLYKKYYFINYLQWHHFWKFTH